MRTLEPSGLGIIRSSSDPDDIVAMEMSREEVAPETPKAHAWAIPPLNEGTHEAHTSL